MLKMIKNNPWWGFWGWVFSVLGFFKIDVYTMTGALFNMSGYPWIKAIEWSLIGGAFWFGVHAYYRSTRYLNDRKDILDNILLLLQKYSNNEEDLKKISEILNKPDYKEMLSRALNINIDT